MRAPIEAGGLAIPNADLWLRPIFAQMDARVDEAAAFTHMIAK
jgi:hypothetical protein